MVGHEKMIFARRLNQALAAIGLPARGRPGYLVELMKKGGLDKISATATGKWLKAESVPSVDNLMLLAKGLDVSFEWLATGRGPMKGPITLPDELRDLVEAYQLMHPRGKSECLGYAAYVMAREEDVAMREKGKVLQAHSLRLSVANK